MKKNIKDERIIFERYLLLNYDEAVELGILKPKKEDLDTINKITNKLTLKEMELIKKLLR